MIDQFNIGEETEISEMVLKVFDTFVGFEYSEAGKKHFIDYIQPGAILLTYKSDGKIAGIIEVRDSKHISLFFVGSQYQQRGIGKTLMNEVIQRLKGKTDTISVNSSRYAENIYAAFGFQKTGELQEQNGIRFIPMLMQLNTVLKTGLT